KGRHHRGLAVIAAITVAWLATPLMAPASAMFVQQTKLTAGGEIGRAGFGASVALSSDDNTALIGGEGDNGHVGAAWVLTRSGSACTQQGPKLTASGETGQAGFGASVAISSDGNTALIGGATYPGATLVFTRSG